MPVGLPRKNPMEYLFSGVRLGGEAKQMCDFPQWFGRPSTHSQRCQWVGGDMCPDKAMEVCKTQAGLIPSPP